MVRVRKLVLAIAAASALSSGMAHALGLGEVTLQSALNQPLVAEIELLEVRDLGSSEVLPSLASPEAFSKAGVDRQYVLTDLKFTPVVKPNGKSVIRVTSSKPMREPYLNFLVEVLWPNGRLLREYTLLLDPPLYTPQSVLSASAPVTAAAVAPRVQIPVAPRQPITPVAPATPAKTPVVATAPRPLAKPVSKPAPAAPAASQTQYKTSSHDTLWEIARRSRTNANVHQTMLAIQDLNPDAFIDGNINRLKSGQVLRLPDEQQIKQRTQGQAVAEVAAQNLAWREGRSLAGSARQVDATKRSVAEAAPAKVETGDSLKLVAAEAGQTAAGSDKGAAERKALSDKLAVTQESLDSTQRENAELKSRMDDLQSQLDKLQRLIQLKDTQLAKLQADLAAPAAPAAAATEAPVAAVEAPVETAPAAVEPVVETVVEAEVAETTPAAPAPEPSVVVAEPAPEAPAVEEVDFNYSEEPSAPPATAVAEAPTTAVSDDASGANDALDELLANPTLLGVAGGGALLALLLALLMLSRRNALKEARLQESLNAEGDALEPEVGLLADDHVAGDSVASEQHGLNSDADERVTAQTADALSEADIYIAYGRLPQAAELLNGAINQEPQRADLRLKLMEVYAEMGERDGFAHQESELRALGGSAAEVDLLKSRFPAMVTGAALATAAVAVEANDVSLDDISLDDLPFEDLAVKAPIEEVSIDDFSFDDFANDEPITAAPAGTVQTDATEIEAAAAHVEADTPEEFSFDVDFTEPAVATTAAAENTEAALAEDFLAPNSLLEEPLPDSAFEGLSLDDFEFDEPSAPSAENAAAVSLEDEFDLSLDELEAELDRDLQAAGDSVSFEPLSTLAVDAGAELAAAPSSTEKTLDDLDFDLSLSDDLGAALQSADNTFAAELQSQFADLQASADTQAQSSETAPTDAGDELNVEPLDADFDLSTDFDLAFNEEPKAPEPATDFAAQLDQVTGELEQLTDELQATEAQQAETPAFAAAAADLDNDDDFDFLSGTDETTTKLDLARAYIDMGDAEGARDILDEVISEGNDGQQQEARELIAKLV